MSLPAPLPTNTGSTTAAPRRPIVVIGGGIIGASCAHYLATAGAPVLLIDRREFGSGCSHGNCGYVSPSHVLPLCRPGAISSTLKTFFKRNSPFKMRFRIDFQFWRWLWEFARRCNRIDALQAGQARHALLQSSRALYDELFANQVIGDCDWETKGLLFVFQNFPHFEEFGKINELLENEFNLGAKRLDGEELVKMEPALKPGLAGAWYYENDAHLRSDKLMQSWKTRLVQDGVMIRENCELIRMEEGDHSVSAILTTNGRIEVDHVVIATGAWTRLLRDQLRSYIPIEPGKGYSITMKRPKICPTYPMLLEDHRVGVTPMGDAYRLGSTMEFAGFDPTLRRDRLKLLTEGASQYLHEPYTEPFYEEWYGWRPMSCDGVPMIGRVPSFKNVWVAAGHSMLGLSMSPATGKLIAEMIIGKYPHIDPHPYRLDRF